jgi:MFS family permease
MPEAPPPETSHHAATARRPQARKRAEPKAAASRLSRSAFALVFAALMTTAAGGNALVSVIPTIGREIGISDTLIATVFSLSALFWTFTSPFWAEQSDRRGRKAMMIVGLGGFTASMLLLGGVVLAGLHGLVLPMVALVGMAVARSVYGLIGAASNPAAQAYVADRTSRAERTGSMAILASAFGLGTIFGPALAPFFVLPVVGLAGPMFAFAIMSTTVMALIWRFLPAGDFKPTRGGDRPTEAPAPDKRVWLDPRIMPFLIYGLAMGSAQALNTQVLPFHVMDAMGPAITDADKSQNLTFISIAMFAGAGASVLAQWGLIRMLDFGPKELIRYGAMAAAGGNALLMIAPNYFTVVIGYALLSLGFGFTRPGFTAGASLAVKGHEQGAVAGAVAAVNGACWLVSPIVGVALYEWRPFSAYALNVACLLGLVWYAYSDKVLRTAGVVAVEQPTAAPPAPV